jgi:hypothetical protein
VCVGERGVIPEDAQRRHHEGLTLSTRSERATRRYGAATACGHCVAIATVATSM